MRAPPYREGPPSRTPSAPAIAASGTPELGLVCFLPSLRMTARDSRAADEARFSPGRQEIEEGSDPYGKARYAGGYIIRDIVELCRSPAEPYVPGVL